ncbi:MAG: hypothetical protein WDW36_005156 [Sanguina aurantia]
MHRQATDTDPLRIYKLLFAGGLAGGVSRTVTAPIDRLKMIMMTQESVKGMSVREGLQQMAAEGSWRSYFRGNGANAVKIAPETAIKLTVNDSLKQVFAADPDDIQWSERLVCGGVAGAFAQALLYPLDTIKTRMALSPSSTYSGIIHCAYCIRNNEGTAAFYRGLVPSMIGILPYAGVDIMVFEILKENLMQKYGGSPPSYMILGAGMLSSSVAQLFSYPLALIRTRLQAQGSQGVPCQYTGMVDVFNRTIEREGWRGLYKGMLPNMVKLAPAAGISWYLFEETKAYMKVLD